MYRPSGVSRLSILGTNSSRAGCYEESLRFLLRAETVMSRLSSNFPSNPTYRFDEMMCIRGLANVMKGLNDRDAEKGYYERALKLMEELVREHPEVPDYLRWLARNNRTLAALHHTQRDWKSAEKYFRHAFDAGKKLAEMVPDVPDDQFRLANCQINIAILLDMKGGKKVAMKNWQQGLALSQELADKYPQASTYRFELAIFLWEFGKMQSYKDSLPYFKKAESEFKTVLASYPAQSQSKSRAFSKIYGSYGFSLLRLKRYSEAMDA